MNPGQVKLFIEQCYRTVFGQTPVVKICKSYAAAEMGPYCINGWISLLAIRERGWLVTTEISERMVWRDLPCVRRLDGLVVVRTNLWQALQVAFAHETHLLTHAAIDRVARKVSHVSPTEDIGDYARLACCQPAAEETPSG